MSNGSFWYGKSIGFPGFLYKQNTGVACKKSTKFIPGGSAVSNTYQDVNNKYKAGNSGIGGQSIATRRAKNRLAAVCATSSSPIPCGRFYNRLGLYDNYTGNPNGFPLQYYAPSLRNNVSNYNPNIHI